jgi:hypothetical protein
MLTMAAAGLALSACTTTPAESAANVSNGRDCAVMTAVLKQHHKIEPGSRLKLQRGDPKQPDAYHITCDFKAAGIPIEDYDYDFVSTGRENFQGWINFAKPTYPQPTLAVVETGYLIGPLAGAGFRCTVRSGVAGWTVEKCEQAWIS